MTINVTTLEANLTTKINATTGTTDGKEFLLLSKAVEAVNTAVSNNSLSAVNNLSDLTDAAAARTNLGLSTSFAALSGATFTGPVTIPNLTVTGTTTTVNSTDLVVSDKNITIADGAADAAAANGAGITVDGASANITYTSATDTWDLNKDLIINTTGALIVPDGTTAQRPSSTSAGAIRFNTDDTSFEGYDGTAWSAIGGGGGGVTVGAITTTYSFDNSTNKVSLSSNATFTPSNMAEGKETFLRITTNAYIPKFSDHVYWFDGAAPDWRQYPIWLINLVCVDGSTIIARPMGYSLTAPKAKFVYHEAGVYTFVVPNNTTQIIAVAIGGGGSGANLGSGGGGGAAMKTFTTTAGTECSLTVGAGGARIKANVGNDGGTSSFTLGSTTISATGGDGGDNNTQVSGGTGTGGDINGTGGKGMSYYNDPETTYNFAEAHAAASGYSGGAGGGGAPSDNGAAQHGGEGSGFAGGGGGGGSDNGDGGNGGQGGPASAYEWAPGGFGGGGGSTDGTRSDAFPSTRMGGYGGGFGGRDAIAANSGYLGATNPAGLRGGDGGGPNGGLAGQGNGSTQSGGGGGGGAFGGGGGGNRTFGHTNDLSAGGGGGAVIILVGHPAPYS